MRVLVVSDTHGRLENFNIALKRAGKIDMLIHAGDVERDADYIRSRLNCGVVIVRGNNDWGSELPQEMVLDMCGIKTFITHGHKYSISFTSDYLTVAAKQKGAELVIHGHTHVPVLKKENGIILLNPGSLTYPRQSGRQPSYALININEKAEMKIKIEYI